MAATHVLLRLPGERTDVWMVRYHGQRPSLFWGLRQLSRAEAAQIVSGARAVLFVGGHLRGRYASAVSEALERYPFVPSTKAVQARLLAFLQPFSGPLPPRVSTSFCAGVTRWP